MNVKNHNFKYGLFLAPMAGVTDRAYRALCVRYGAELVTTELVSAKAVTMGDERTFRLASLTEEEFPAAIQIFGSDPVLNEQAVKAVMKSPKWTPAEQNGQTRSVRLSVPVVYDL